MLQGKESDEDFSNDEGFIGHDPQKDSSDIRERFKQIAKNNEVLEKETGIQSLKRQAKQYGARALETAVSLPGNFKKAFNQSREFLESFKPEGSKNLSELEEEALGSPSIGTLEHSVMNPPTSSEVRGIVTPKIAESLGEDREAFEPKTEFEKGAGEFTQDLTSFFLPGTGQMRMMTRIGAPIVGNLSKEGYKYLTGDEKTAEKVKNGIMLATTIAGQSNPGQFASERIGQGKQMIPQTTTVNASSLAQNLMPLVNRMLRGFKVPSKSRTVQGLQELAQQVDQNGRINLHSLMDARDGINEWISEAGGFDIPKASRPALMRNLNELKTNIIRTIDENLANRFPEAAELYRTGYEAAAVTHESHAITNFIERNFGKKTASIGAKLLFPGLAGGAAVLPKTVGVIGATYPLYKGGQILYRVGQSPTLARYYSEVLRSSSQGNVPVMVKSMEKLDHELEKMEKKEEKKLGKDKKTSLKDFKSKFKNRD